MNENHFFKIAIVDKDCKKGCKRQRSRRETGVPVCFTLDAGANVHVLYPEKDKEAVQEFIKNDLSKYCQDNRYIFDNVGNGAIKL